MATECRSRRRNRYKLVRAEAYMVLIGLVVFGYLIGFFVGKSKAETITETVTYTEIVEVPTFEADRLPEVSDIDFFDIPLSHSLQRYMFEVCADEEVPITLVLAMIEHESSFNPEAISRTEDYGLLQINVINHPALAEKYRAADMLNPYQNVYCGVHILGTYLEKYEGDSTKALMAYNMGDYGARKAWESGIDSTTYTDTILSIQSKYEEVRQNAESNYSN